MIQRCTTGDKSRHDIVVPKVGGSDKGAAIINAGDEVWRVPKFHCQ